MILARKYLSCKLQIVLTIVVGTVLLTQSDKIKKSGLELFWECKNYYEIFPFISLNAAQSEFTGNFSIGALFKLKQKL